MKRGRDGKISTVIRPTETLEFMRLQHDSGNCPTKKCAFRYKTRTMIEKTKKQLLEQELEAHNIDVPKGGKLVLTNTLIDHYAADHGIVI